VDKIFSLIGHYGYLAVFFGVMLESTGVPLPGETILIASGVLAQRGHIDVGDVIVLTAGLVVAAACLWLFGGLAEEILTNDPLVRYDRTLADYRHSKATPPLTTFFLVVTAFGSIEVIALLGLLVAAVFAWRRRWLFLGTWLSGVVGSAVLNRLLKGLFVRPRPFFEHPLLIETSYSFPSGHAMDSFAVYGMLAYFVVVALRSWRARTAVVFGAALLVLLIGLSRMYLGVHYFSDVVAGYAAGGVWLSALITGSETIRRARDEYETRVEKQSL
jgi:membrane-associated phospholipid phosphatase